MRSSRCTLVRLDTPGKGSGSPTSRGYLVLLFSSKTYSLVDFILPQALSFLCWWMTSKTVSLAPISLLTFRLRDPTVLLTIPLRFLVDISISICPIMHSEFCTANALFLEHSQSQQSSCIRPIAQAKRFSITLVSALMPMSNPSQTLLAPPSTYTPYTDPSHCHLLSVRTIAVALSRISLLPTLPPTVCFQHGGQQPSFKNTSCVMSLLYSQSHSENNRKRFGGYKVLSAPVSGTSCDLLGHSPPH